MKLIKRILLACLLAVLTMCVFFIVVYVPCSYLLSGMIVKGLIYIFCELVCTYCLIIENCD